MRRSLSKLNVGDVGKVREIRLKGAAQMRLAELGLVPGTEIMVIRKAPFGGPVEISLRGYRLSVRLAQADGVSIELYGEGSRF